MKFFEQKNINTPDEELLNHFQKENDLEILGVLYNSYHQLQKNEIHSHNIFFDFNIEL